MRTQYLPAVTGPTAYLKNSGKHEVAQHVANQESLRTTKLDDRRDEISLDESRVPSPIGGVGGTGEADAGGTVSIALEDLVINRPAR